MIRRLCGFTLVELLVVISIIALLLAILMPSLNKARQQGKAVVCLSNLRQMGLATTMYLQDTQYYVVQNGYYAVSLSPYLVSTTKDTKKISAVFHCPLDRQNEKGFYYKYTFGSINSYCINMYFDLQNSNRLRDWKYVRAGEVRRPPSRVFMRADQYWSELGTNWVCNRVKTNPDRNVIADTWEKKMTWHKEKSNMLYCDGHVETLKKSDALTGSLANNWPLK